MGKRGPVATLDPQKEPPIRLRVGQREKLQTLSRVTGCSVAELIREAVDDLCLKLTKESNND